MSALLANEFFTYHCRFWGFYRRILPNAQQSKNILGRLAYIFESLKRLPDLMEAYHLVVEYEGETIEDDFIFVW